MHKIIHRSHASRKRRQAKTTENAANWKRLVKASEKFADAEQRIAEMLAILAKSLPPVGHQSSAEEPDFEELHEKPEPKDVRPIPNKKPNPVKDTFEDEEKDTLENVVEDEFDGVVEDDFDGVVKDDFDGDDDWAAL
jgi:hypothetical protein